MKRSAVLFRHPGVLASSLVSMAACAEAPPLDPGPNWDDFVFPAVDAGMDAGGPAPEAGSLTPPPVMPVDAGASDAGQDPGSDAGQLPDDAGSQEPPEPDAGSPPVEEPDAGQSGCSETLCGSSCVDLDTSTQHCGSCDHACPGGAACSQGVCAAPSSNCRYELREGHDYLFCSDERSWAQARDRCLDWGLDLAIVDGDAENAFLTGSENHWFGLNDRDDEGQFRWIVPGNDDGESGAEPALTKWAQGEPNNDERCTIPVVLCSREHCGELRSDGSWNDSQCSDGKAYVCESY